MTPGTCLALEKMLSDRTVYSLPAYSLGDASTATPLFLQFLPSPRHSPHHLQHSLMTVDDLSDSKLVTISLFFAGARVSLHGPAPNKAYPMVRLQDLQINCLAFRDG